MTRTRQQHAWLDDAADQARAFLARAPSCCSAAGYVYIVQAGDLVKIGRSSSDLPTRMKSLQAMSPVKVDLVALGRGARLEGLFHTWFAGSRRHGEWFTADAIRRWLRRWRDDHCLCCELAQRPTNE